MPTQLCSRASAPFFAAQTSPLRPSLYSAALTWPACEIVDRVSRCSFETMSTSAVQRVIRDQDGQHHARKKRKRTTARRVQIDQVETIQDTVYLPGVTLAAPQPKLATNPAPATTSSPADEQGKPMSNNQLKKQRYREWQRQQKLAAKKGGSYWSVEQAPTVVSSLVKEQSSKEPTRAVAIDCEMVGVGTRGSKDMLARVSIVNAFGHTLYDKYVKPMETVTDYRTFVSGISPHHLSSGLDFFEVQKEVCALLKGRTLVGHAIKNDLKVLFLDHPKKDIRDTSKYFNAQAYGGKGTPSLRRLTEHHIGVKIQGQAHDSVEDARATMRLYTMFKKTWEAEVLAKFRKKFGEPGDWDK